MQLKLEQGCLGGGGGGEGGPESSISRFVFALISRIPLVTISKMNNFHALYLGTSVLNIPYFIIFFQIS